MTCEKHTLGNGLKVLISPLKGTRTVTVLILFGTGSKYETKRINGISHFLEHLFFKGTKKRPNTKVISEELDRVGGIYNAFTGKEETGYWVKVDASHFPLALDVVSDMLLHSTFKIQEIEREKGVILEEINMYRDTPMEYVGELFEELLYGNQPAGRSIAGEPKIIQQMPRSDIVSYKNKQYVGSNAVVAIAGNISSNEALRFVTKHFKTLPAGHAMDKPLVKEEQKSPRVKLYFKNTDQTHLMLGVRAYGRSHPDRYALTLLATILGGNMSSRLFIAIRERKGLAYYIRALPEVYTDSGYLAVHAGIKNKRTHDAVRFIVKEFRRIKRETVSTQELSKAREYLKGKMQINLEASNAVASYWAEQELLDGKTKTVRQLFFLLDKVTPRDIRRVANDIFQNNNLNLALVGSERSETSFIKTLRF